ncbi:MAG: indolepyruvate oxidoreductase subunit beta [Bilophila wadsworthia]
MKKTIRFLITGVGGQGTILASDILAEVGLRLGHDAKKSDILGLAVRGGSVVSHIIWGENVRAPMIDRGTADYYLSFEWLEGLRRLVYTNKDTVVLANDWRIDPVSVSSGQADYPDEDGIRAAIRERCAGLREIPATPLAVEMGNARVFNSVMMGGLAQLVGGRGRLALRRGGHRRPQGTRPERQGLRRRAFLRAVGHPPARPDPIIPGGPYGQDRRLPPPLRAVSPSFCEASHV